MKHDPSLDVRITSIRDLRYDAGADAALDRPVPDGSLLALGSGSMAKRMRAVHVRRGVVNVIDAQPFYLSLSERKDFAGAELNLEGATVFEQGGRTWLRLFQRGNGNASAGPAFDAIAEVPLEDLLAGRATSPRSVRRYDLGRADGVRLTFSDATPVPGATAFLTIASRILTLARHE